MITQGNTPATFKPSLPERLSDKKPLAQTVWQGQICLHHPNGASMSWPA